VILTCPVDKQTYHTFTEFWTHVRKAHAAALVREVDVLTVRKLGQDHKERVERDEQIQAVINKVTPTVLKGGH
jgi:hypothetical protein